MRKDDADDDCSKGKGGDNLPAHYFKLLPHKHDSDGFSLHDGNEEKSRFKVLVLHAL